jgi:hypothetical protein
VAPRPPVQRGWGLPSAVRTAVVTPVVLRGGHGRCPAAPSVRLTRFERATPGFGPVLYPLSYRSGLTHVRGSHGRSSRACPPNLSEERRCAFYQPLTPASRMAAARSAGFEPALRPGRAAGASSPAPRLSRACDRMRRLASTVTPNFWGYHPQRPVRPAYDPCPHIGKGERRYAVCCCPMWFVSGRGRSGFDPSACTGPRRRYCTRPLAVRLTSPAPGSAVEGEPSAVSVRGRLRNRRAGQHRHQDAPLWSSAARG